jgi:hypothetical protein
MLSLLVLLLTGAPSAAAAQALAAESDPASTAFNAYTDDPAAADDSPESLRARSEQEPGPSDTQAAPGPSGCVQQANNPHGSHHQPGRMNAEVRATCGGIVPHMEHTSQLWERRWWGYDRIGVVGSFNRNNVSQGSAFGNDVCRNNYVHATGSGFVTDIDGRNYYASTQSNTIHNPCNL